MLIKIPPVEKGRYSTKDRYHIFEFLIPISVPHFQWVFRVIIANTFLSVDLVSGLSQVFL